MHTQFWGTDTLMALDWLPPMNNDLYKGAQAMAEALFPVFSQHFADRLPADAIASIGRTCERYTDLLDHVVSIGTPTFAHTDCRAESYLFDDGTDGGPVTVIDFQLSTRHWGMYDVTNLIAGSMQSDLRRKHEADLIAEYVTQVNAAGIDYTVEQAMLEYRLCLLQQTVAQVVTTDLQGGNERGAQLLEQLQLRPIRAAIDNHVFDLLDTF